MRNRRLQILSLILTLVACVTLTGISAVGAEGQNQVSAHIDWAGINLTTDTALSQTIKPLNVPSTSIGNVDWGIHIGNSERYIFPNFQLSNSGMANFAFYDVPAGSKVENAGKSTCKLRSPNAFQTANTWRAECSAPLMPVAGETYEFVVKPLKINGSQWWAGSVTIQSTGEVILLGRIENNPSPAVLNASQSMTGMNQITFWKETLPPCSSIPDFSAIYGPVLTTTGSAAKVSGTRLSETCPGLSAFDTFSTPGSYRINIGNTGSTQETTLSSIAGAQPGSYYAANIKPSAGGSPIRKFCPKGKVVTQIRVAPQIDNVITPGFKFGCSALSSDGSLGTTTDIVEIVNRVAQESDYIVLKCGPNQAVTSISAATGNYVRDLSITCSDTSPFSLGKNPKVGIGSGLPLNAESACTESISKVAFITGFNAYAAAGLDTVQAICTPFNLKGSSSTQPVNNTKPERPTFSLVNFTGNKVNINVNLGSGANQPDKIYLIAPKIGATEAKKVYGKISGNIATWSFSLNNLLSGDSVPMKIVSLRNGIESDSLEENFTVPSLSSVVSDKAVPLAPKKITSRVIGTSGIVTAVATIKPGAMAKSAYLFGNSLGISSSKVLEGEVIGAKVVFEIPIKSSMTGKTFSFTIYFENDAGKSVPVQGKISIPGLPKISTEGLAIPNKSTVGKTILCSKGSQSRPFVAKSCPPGWKKN